MNPSGYLAGLCLFPLFSVGFAEGQNDQIHCLSIPHHPNVSKAHRIASPTFSMNRTVCFHSTARMRLQNVNPATGINSLT
jgi:hypothetical protein